MNVSTQPRQCSAPSSTSFEIVENGQAIKLPCGRVSYHPKDVENKFAACCGRFLADEQRMISSHPTRPSTARSEEGK